MKVLCFVTGPACSSLAYGAMQELGPFRVHSDGKTLYKNRFSWNQGKLSFSSIVLTEFGKLGVLKKLKYSLFSYLVHFLVFENPKPFFFHVCQNYVDRILLPEPATSKVLSQTPPALILCLTASPVVVGLRRFTSIGMQSIARETVHDVVVKRTVVNIISNQTVNHKQEDDEENGGFEWSDHGERKLQKNFFGNQTDN